MEYGNNATYIGEWSANNRHGKGRMERDHKVISGNYKQNDFSLACAVDLDEVMKPIYQTDLPKSMQSYLRSKKYTPPEVRVPRPELNEALNIGLIEILRQSCCAGEIKGHIFRKIRYLLKDKIALRDISLQIHKAFSIPPNNSEILQTFKEIIPPAIENGQCGIKWFGLNFNNVKQPEVILSHLVITNDCVLGEGVEEYTGQKYSIDGLYGGNGTLRIFLKQRSETLTLNCIAGPNYLTGIDSKENKFFLLPDIHMYKGFFTTKEEPNNKQLIRYFMKISGDLIYGTGRDNAGLYIISGAMQPIEAHVADPEDEAIGHKTIAALQFKIIYAEGYQLLMEGKIDKHGEIVSLSYSARRVEMRHHRRQVHAQAKRPLHCRKGPQDGTADPRYRVCRGRNNEPVCSQFLPRFLAI